jgi:hypothetical protein
MEKTGVTLCAPILTEMCAKLSACADEIRLGIITTDPSQMRKGWPGSRVPSCLDAYKPRPAALALAKITDVIMRTEVREGRGT